MKVSKDALEPNPTKWLPAGKEVPLDLKALQSLLGLDGRRCGALKVDRKGLCKQRIPSTQDLVDKQLKILAALPQGADDLHAQLEKLVDLVHCRYHKQVHTKDARVKDWKTFFPTDENKPEPAIPISQHIKETLPKVTTVCLGATPEGKDCGYRIGGQRLQNYEKTIDEIIQPKIYLNDRSLEYFLQVLEVNKYCPRHENPILKNAATWKAKIVEIRNKAQPKKPDPDEDEDKKISLDHSEGPGGTTSADKKSPDATENISVLVVKREEPDTVDFARKPAEYWPITKDTSPLIILEQKKPAEAYSADRRIRALLVKPVLQRGKESGYVYAFEVEGNKGFVKIGFTTRDKVEERHKEWEFDCNRVTKALYPVPPDDGVRILLPHLVEKLCHEELKHHRIKIDCKACRKPHVEYFQISREEAVAVVQRWTRWMRTNPYEEIKEKAFTKWHLKDDEIRKTADMKSFMHGLSLLS